MSHVPLIDRDDAHPSAQELLTQINAAFGVTPNMFKAVANSPAALQSMWGAFQAFGGGSFGPALGEQIAVAVANRNSCDYCLSAHTALGRKAGVSSEDLAAAQSGESTDPRTAALLGFALSLVENRGQVTEQEVQKLREHGWTNEHIVELIGQVALNLFTNYVNVALAVPVDFPSVKLRKPAAIAG